MKKLGLFTLAATSLMASSMAFSTPQIKAFNCTPDPAQTDRPLGSPETLELFTDLDLALHANAGQTIPGTLTMTLAANNLVIKYALVGTITGSVLPIPGDSFSFTADKDADATESLVFKFAFGDVHKVTAVAKVNADSTAPAQYTCSDEYSWIIN